MVLKLVRPTLREAVLRGLPPDLGDFVLDLRSAAVLAAEFEVRNEPRQAVVSTSLDGGGADAYAARKLIGWSVHQVRGFLASQQTLFAEDRGARRPMTSLQDVMLYLARFESPPPAPLAAISSSSKTAISRSTVEPQLELIWAEASVVLSAALPMKERWRWADAADAARRLRRRPVRVVIQLPTLAGDVALGSAHNCVTLKFGSPRHNYLKANVETGRVGTRSVLGCAGTPSRTDLCTGW